jgi:predicted CXXCH cytochrome family protein
MVPVSISHSHPMGKEVNPKVATVTQEFLRDGKLECVGCHDPHASNPNWALLRVDTQQGTDMDTFCAMCHATKADASTVAAIKKVQIFTSMDETKPPAAPPAVKAGAPAAPVASPPPAAPAATPTPGPPPATNPPAEKS